MTKKLISMFFCVLLAVGIMTTFAHADDGLEGSGTAESPYLIKSSADLIAFCNLVNSQSSSVCGKLKENINMEGELWKGMTNFTGIFNGNGYAISNLSGTEGIVVKNGGTIKNVVLKNAYIRRDGGNLGAIVGKNLGNGKVYNCASSGIVSGTNYSIGGIVGWNNGGEIAGCVSSCTVSGMTAGGLVGSNYPNGNVKYSLYSGDSAKIEGDNPHGSKNHVYYKSGNEWKSFTGEAADRETVFSEINAFISSNGGTLVVKEDENGALNLYRHIFTNYISDSNATCTADGTETAKCDYCDETDIKTDADSKLGHRFTDYASDNNAACTVDGTKTAKCDYCDEINITTDAGSRLGHRFTNYVSDNNATCTADGTQTAKCDRCGVANTRMDAGSMVPHSYKNGACSECGAVAPNDTPAGNSTQTGDSSNMLLWFTVLITSGLVITALTIGLKKKIRDSNC